MKPEDHFTFWHFDSSAAQDGEDIKDAFKSHFEAVAAQLTEMERRDVVVEAVWIFQMCGELVGELDRVLALCDEGRKEKDAHAGPRRPTALYDLPLVQAWTRNLYGALVWMWGLAVVAPMDGKAERTA